MIKLLGLCMLVILLVCSRAARADLPDTGVLAIDLTGSPAPIIKGHLGMGAARSPSGQIVNIDSRCFYMNGTPWIPVSGEFHYSRYPRAEWRDELLKMKAGGVDIVSTYVFWIHHEEHQGEWDWSGQRSLRDFVQLCGDVGLKVVVRMGPWVHGEARNGGFPDWIQARPDDKRRNLDPEFMALTGIYFKQIAQQIDGLLWKDGGPVIGVQLDNECGKLPYLFALKELARKCGVDVPFYSMTGWNNVPIPDGGLLPLFGGYADGFWPAPRGSFESQYFFTSERNSLDLGAIGPVTKSRQKDILARLERFPYVCCEIGGGMPSSYERRVFVAPQDTAALALVKIGCGNNMPGYYMYQGGINPDGKYTDLQQSSSAGFGDPNDMPVKDYDFSAPLGANGEVREHYYLLREQHLFLKDRGAELALMPPFFPTNRPSAMSDTETVRWSVRSEGSRAFLFFNNHQRFGTLPAKEKVQFFLTMKDGACLVPQTPVTIPSGAYGIWPVNMDCAGLKLTYATAQPLCRLDDQNEHWFFFVAIDGIPPEFKFAGADVVAGIVPGTGIALTRKAPDQSDVHFVVLTAEQGKQVWKTKLAGRERVVLSDGAILQDTDTRLRIETLGAAAPFLSVFPPVQSAQFAGAPALTNDDGAFQRLSPATVAQPAVNLAVDWVKSADASNTPLDGVQESSWEHAAIWKLKIPEGLTENHQLKIDYAGDVARVYAGGKLIADHFYNGQPVMVSLWRIPKRAREQIEVRILPFRADRTFSLGVSRLPSAGAVQLSGVQAVPRKQWSLEAAD